MRCSPTLFSVQRTVGDYSSWWLGSYKVGQRQFFHAVSMPTSSQGVEYPLDLVLRMACHVLVDQIPEGGLRELCESVNDIFQFHLECEGSRPRASLGRAATIVQARVAGVHERPVFGVHGE